MAFTERYPAHQYAATGQKILAALNAKHPAEFVAQASPSSPEATKVVAGRSWWISAGAD